jgi:hypothetical protein
MKEWSKSPTLNKLSELAKGTAEVSAEIKDDTKTGKKTY